VRRFERAHAGSATPPLPTGLPQEPMPSMSIDFVLSPETER
jgi:hypothetical protein